MREPRFFNTNFVAQLWRTAFLGPLAAVIALGPTSGVAGASGSPSSGHLAGAGFATISCSSAGRCTAVGNYGSGALVEVSHGGLWSVVPQPAVPQAEIPSGGDEDHLHGLACTRSTSCVAVGSYDVHITAVKTLVEALSGTSLSVVPSPTPPSQEPVTRPPAPYSGGDAGLQGISCATASSCMAVGYDIVNATTDTETTLAEQWDGSSWSIVPTTDISSTGLGAVSCPSPSMCMAIGAYMDTGATNILLAERWDGSKWSVLAVPGPAPVPRLDGLTCTSTSNCWAVGNYTKAGQAERTLAEHWDGSSWKMVLTPNPAGSDAPGLPIVLGSVACASATSCVAVGTDNRGPAGHAVAYSLAEMWNGS